MTKLTHREIQESLEECYGHEGNAHRIIELRNRQKRLDEMIERVDRGGRAMV